MRILRNTPTNAKVIFYQDGVQADPDGQSVTVVVKDDTGGTVSSGAATRDTVAPFPYVYPISGQANLGLLTVEWTGLFSGLPVTVETQVEVVGAHLFTVSAAKAFDGGDLAGVDNAEIEDERDRITDMLEAHTGVSWVPRFRKDVISGDGTDWLMVYRPKVSKVLSVHIDGVALTQDELDDLVVQGAVLHRKSATWPAGFANIVVRYEHGMDRLMDGVDRIGLILLRERLIVSNISRRTLSTTDELGTTRYAVPGELWPLGLPEVDSWVKKHQAKVGVW